MMTEYTNPFINCCVAGGALNGEWQWFEGGIIDIWLVIKCLVEELTYLMPDV